MLYNVPLYRGLNAQTKNEGAARRKVFANLRLPIG